jgi:hypothetical protein
MSLKTWSQGDSLVANMESDEEVLVVLLLPDESDWVAEVVKQRAADLVRLAHA